MMATQDAFDFDEQREHLERVSSRIARAIIQFLRGHRQFHADELRKYVLQEVGITAPGSADRILRDLRQRKLIDYKVVNRHESLYETLWIKGDEEV
jgi:hypothetical protein